MLVGASLHRFIIGKGGSTQKMIEDETGVKIKIPLSKREDSIIIEGLSNESVTRASEKIQVIIDENCIRGSFAKAGVLYAPVEEIGSEGRLLCACQVIIDAFVKAGLVLEKDANQKLKLHATVMNARHRKRSCACILESI